MTEDDVDGTVTLLDESGLFKLPRQYVEASKFVYRDPSKTVDMPSGRPVEKMWFDPTVDVNPDLSPDRITLKRCGDDVETYRVTNPERVDDS